MIAGLIEQFKASERQACKALELRRSVYRYRPRPNGDGEIIKLLLELAHGRPTPANNPSPICLISISSTALTKRPKGWTRGLRGHYNFEVSEEAFGI